MVWEFQSRPSLVLRSNFGYGAFNFNSQLCGMIILILSCASLDNIVKKVFYIGRSLGMAANSGSCVKKKAVR